jgi:T5SS/PEP-CTERM-associated repeat protein
MQSRLICLSIAAIAGVCLLASLARAYETNGKWPQTSSGTAVTLTYSYSNLLDGTISSLSAVQLSAAVTEALQLWSAVAPLQFEQATDSGVLPTSADANYSATNRPRLRYGQHSIDGALNTLAHGYFPLSTNSSGLAGDVHLDSAEAWQLSPSANVIDVLYVLTHETGHALGLNHEDDVPSIMHTYYSATYSGLTTGFLYQDDINGIQSLYGTGFGYVHDSSGRLYLSGTSGGNTISLNVNGTTITATSAGYGSFTRTTTDVTALEINTRNGTDEIHLAGLTGSITDVRIISGSVYVESGTVTHGGSASTVDNYYWSQGAVVLSSGMLTVQGSEYGATGGTASFTQSGGTHAIAGNLSVGNDNSGSLILTGGTLSNTDGFVGAQAGSVGTVSISGAGTHWMNRGNLLIGNAGQGTVTVTEGAIVTVQGLLTLGAQGRLGGNGTLEANILNHGIVSPGNLLGSLSITGNYTQATDGQLLIELFDVNQFDKLVVSHSASLSGILEIELETGSALQLHDSFDVLDWGSISGSFSTIFLPTLDGALQWNLAELYLTGKISVVQAGSFTPPGDFDADGDVDGADFVIWQTHFPTESGAQLSTGDADGDGDVDGADFVAWQTHFPTAPGSSIVSVSEPSALMLALLAFAVISVQSRALPTSSNN